MGTAGRQQRHCLHTHFSSQDSSPGPLTFLSCPLPPSSCHPRVCPALGHWARVRHTQDALPSGFLLGTRSHSGCLCSFFMPRFGRCGGVTQYTPTTCRRGPSSFPTSASSLRPPCPVLWAVLPPAPGEDGELAKQEPALALGFHEPASRARRALRPSESLSGLQAVSRRTWEEGGRSQENLQGARAQSWFPPMVPS